MTNTTRNPVASDDSKRWPKMRMKTEARSATLIDGLLQLKAESLKPQAVKKAVTVLLLSCQHHLISTEQITCTSLTNFISFFSSSLWRFPQPYVLFRQETPWRVLNSRFDGQELSVTELSQGADIGWAHGAHSNGFIFLTGWMAQVQGHLQLTDSFMGYLCIRKTKGDCSHFRWRFVRVCLSYALKSSKPTLLGPCVKPHGCVSICLSVHLSTFKCF